MTVLDQYALTPTEVDELRQRGFLILRGRIPAATLDAVGRAFAAAVDNIARDRGVDEARVLSWAELPYDERYRAMRAAGVKGVGGAWRRVMATRAVYDLWQLPPLLGAIRSVAGDELLAHGIWNGRPRVPRSRQRVGWHQDAHYYRDWNPADGLLLSAWMPLVPVDASTSCLEFVPGSHRRGWIERTRDVNYGFTVDPEEVTGVETVVAEMEPGDVVIFTDTTLHQSTENVSDRIRWSIDIRFAQATPALVKKNRRGYRCWSGADPSSVESYEAWVERYEYDAEELVDELENFAGMDEEQVRQALRGDSTSIY